MKNHVVKFSQFVNEMAKGDYFRTKSDPTTYGMHRGGSSDWSYEQPEFEPDDELSADEFMDKYSDAVDTPNFQNWKKSWKPDERVKVWKGLDKEGPKFKRKQKQDTDEVIQNMSTLHIQQTIDAIEKMKSGAPTKAIALLPKLMYELYRRGE